MKKLALILLATALCLLYACGEAAPEERGAAVTTLPVTTQAATTEAPTTETYTTLAVPTTCLPEPKPNWQEAYSDYILNCYQGVHGFITLGLADFDKSGVPELVILDDSKGTLGGAFSVITYKDRVATKLIASGTSSSYTISNNGKDIYFYRDFHSMHSSGGTYGYGYVSALKSVNGVFSCTPLLQAKITDFSFEDNEDLRSLAWEVDTSEEDVLHHKEFTSFLSIQKSTANGEWQDISADEYLRLKNSFIGNNPTSYRGYERGDPYALPEIRYDCFDMSSDNSDDHYGGLPSKDEIDTFFAQWEQR